MGFYTTDERAAVLEPCQENLIPPSKNRVWNFFTTTETCTGFFESQPVESHQEKWPTPTTTVSGVRYYGYRQYIPEIGRWASRDPLGEVGHSLIRALAKVSTQGRRNFSLKTYLKSAFVPHRAGKLSNRIVEKLNHQDQAVSGLHSDYNFSKQNPVNSTDFLGLQDMTSLFGGVSEVQAWQCWAGAPTSSQIEGQIFWDTLFDYYSIYTAIVSVPLAAAAAPQILTAASVFPYTPSGQFAISATSGVLNWATPGPPSYSDMVEAWTMFVLYIGELIEVANE